jgi:hypothetical protein
LRAWLDRRWLDLLGFFIFFIRCSVFLVILLVILFIFLVLFLFLAFLIF